MSAGTVRAWKRAVPVLIMAGALSTVALAFGAGSAMASGTVNCPPYGAGTAADVTAAAAGGGTVTINGTCHGNVDVSTSVTLQGGSPGATLDGDGSGTVLTVHSGAHVTVRNLTITDGSVGGPGGGVYEHDCGTTVTLVNSTVRDSSAGSGGGVFADTCTTLNVQASTITHNEAGTGGGIFGFDATVNVTNSRVTSNSAPVGGGLMAQNDTTLNMTGGTVSNNTALYEGGGMLVIFSEASVAGSTISSNAVTQAGVAYGGGGIWLSHADVLLSSTHVSWNTSSDFGGGIAYYGGVGGGCFLQQPCGNGLNAPTVTPGSGLTLTSSTVDHNRANDDGGGIYNRADNGDGPVTLDQSTISFNSALSGDGGGISNYGSCGTTASITATGSWFGGNLALQGEGGAVYQSNGDGCGSGGTALVTLSKTQVGRINTTVNSDRARYGGGIFNESGDGTSNVTLQPGANVVSNKASVDGGGVFNCGGATLSVAPGAVVLSNSPDNIVNKLLCP